MSDTPIFDSLFPTKREKRMIEEVNCYEITCRPMSAKFPIRSMVVSIYAKTMEDAHKIMEEYSPNFFDEDMTMSWKTFGGGYRQVDEKAE
jgi:hypothetical protein